MKLLFTLWTTGLTGGTRAIFEVANRLGKKNYEVEIIALGDDHSWYPVNVPVNYIRVPERSNTVFQAYRLLTFKFDRKYDYLKLERIAKRLGFHVDFVRALAESIPECDACIATWYPTAFAVWFSGKGKPYYFLQDFSELVVEVSGIYGLRMFEATLKLPFYFLTNSTYTKELVLKHQADASVNVVSVGVDTKMFYHRNTRIVDSKSRKVMAIFRGLKYKGDDVAIKALNELNKRTPIHAILVGPVISLQKVKPEFPYTHFERVDDDTLATLYSSADVFIYTSYAEGFGLPPLEAMACEVPVVTTDCKGNRDYTINEYNALVVPPGNPAAVVNAVLRVLTDNTQAEKLRESGIETSKKYTWDYVVMRVEEALRES